MYRYTIIALAAADPNIPCMDYPCNPGASTGGDDWPNGMQTIKGPENKPGSTPFRPPHCVAIEFPTAETARYWLDTSEAGQQIMDKFTDVVLLRTWNAT